MSDEKTALVIDADAKHRQTVCSILASNGLRTLQAKDGLEGLRIIDAQRPDLVVSEVNLPEVDGFTLARALKQNNEMRNLIVVFLTSKVDPMSMIEGVNVGAKHYMTKPLQADDFTGKIRRLMNIR